MEQISVKATLNDDGSVTATWSAVSGAERYRATMYPSKHDYAVYIEQNLTSTSYTSKPNLPANDLYEIIVAAYRNGIVVASSSAKVLIPSDFYRSRPVAVPQNIKAVATVSDVEISFDPVTYATGYDILFDNKVYSITSTRKIFNGLAAKTSHTYAVRAKNAKYTSSYSATQTIKTKPVSPAVPSGIKKTVTETSATISWNAVSGAIGYDILFNGSTYSTTSASRTFTGLTAGGSYTFQIRARNADVAGAYTSQLTVALPPKAPASVSATSTGDSVTVSWSQVAGAAGYIVRCGDNEVVMPGTSTSQEFVGLKPLTTYTYQVCSRSVDGAGSYGAAKTIKTLVKVPVVPPNISWETTENSVTVSWSAVSDATGYDILFDGSTYSVTGTSKTFTGLQDNTEYTYRVRSKNAGGVSEYGAEKRVRTTPKAPSSTSAESDENSVTIKWDPVNGAQDYDLEFDGKVYKVKGTSHKITGLKPNTSYKYRIRVNNKDGSSSYSKEKTHKTAPNRPSSCKETATRNSVSLSWDPVSGATSYDVLFDGKTYRVTGTSKTISGLTANKAYKYSVRANNSDGSSSYSSEKTVTTLPDPPAAYPTIKATATADSVTLTWNAVSGAVEYELTFDGKVYTVKGTSYRFTGLYDETDYRYRIRSSNVSGFSSYSPYGTVRTLLKAPAVPSGIRASADIYTITINWNKQAKVDGYDVYCNGTVYTATGTTRIIGGLNPDTSYRYQVRARNSAGTSAYSAAYTIRTLAAPPVRPTNLHATATSNSVTVTWNAVSGAAGYTLSFQDTNYNVTGTSKTITGLTPGTDYRYAVCAYNTGGNSGYTDYQMIKTIPGVPQGIRAEAKAHSVRIN